MTIDKWMKMNFNFFEQQLSNRHYDKMVIHCVQLYYDAFHIKVHTIKFWKVFFKCKDILFNMRINFTLKPKSN